MARKTSDIAMLLGARSKARTSKSTGMTAKLVGFIDSMLGRSNKQGRRQERREQSVPMMIFAVALLAAFGGGYAVGGGFAKGDGTDPLRVAGRVPVFVDEVNTKPMSTEAFIVSVYKGVAPEDAKQRASSLAKYLRGKGLEKARPYPYPDQETGTSIWVVAVYFDGEVEAEDTRAELNQLPSNVPDAVFQSIRGNYLAKGHVWPGIRAIPKE